MPTNMITTAFVLLIPLPPNPLARSQYQQFPKVCQSRQRRFLPPWIIEEDNNACFIVRDATGQALAYFYDAFLQLSHTIGPHFETLDRLGRKPPISDGGNPSGR
jgi:hypothetical protein